MVVKKEDIKLAPGQQRVLKLLFKFRFISTQLLADIMGIKRRSVYEVLELLIEKELVDKVYEKDFRYAKKPAYYYLNKQGVTTVRKLMDVSGSVVNPLYRNSNATEEFIYHCLTTAACYIAIGRTFPDATDIFTKSEINRYKQFPKNRPDLYIRTESGQEAIIIIVDDKPSFIIRKRLDEIIEHSEDEGWPSGDYPRICFILKDDRAKNSLIYATNKKLDGMGFDEDEIKILASSLRAVKEGSSGRVWFNGFNPKTAVPLFE
jgi:predicted transcriptional regulator